MSSPVRLEVDAVTGHRSLQVARTDVPARLTDILRQRHVPLNTRCGQRGLCDGCVVELLEGELIKLATGERVEAHQNRISLRGCEYRLGDRELVRLHIPPRSLLAYEPQVVSEFKYNVPRAHDPLWQQVQLPRSELPAGPLTADTLAQTVARRTQRRRPVRLAPAAAAALGSVTADGRLFATTEYREDHWLITEVAAEPRPRPLGVAVDIGTTTVAVVVVDLRTGEIVGSSANFNRQMHLGDDVLTRINLCSTDPLMLPHLQELIVRETIAPLILDALEKAHSTPAHIHCLTCAANTTMLHLFAGIDPSPMGVAPFTPRFINHRVLNSAALPFPAPLAEHPFTVHLLPGAAAYVGADLTAGAFATGLVYDDGPSLLVDVGTNGEIILKQGANLFGCATAAGPAFEGAGLTNGVRATEGAIAHLELGRDPFTVKTEIIGQHQPIGLCGTAYVDFLAEGRRVGLLTNRGRFDALAVGGGNGRLIPWKDYGHALRVAYGPGKTDIVISEIDIANLLQAKAAIAAGILTLLERIGIAPREIRRLYLAGGFGLHLHRAHAIGCGLLPGFKPEQIEVVGNSSLAGAYLALLDCGALDEVARCGRRMEVIELNLDPGFEDRYVEQLSLPD